MATRIARSSVDVRPGLLGGADVGPADDLDAAARRRGCSRSSEYVGCRGCGRRAADVGRLAGVLLEVGPLDADAVPSGSSSQPSTLIGSSYWLIW